jgi:hypothetical protein
MLPVAQNPGNGVGNQPVTTVLPLANGPRLTPRSDSRARVDTSPHALPSAQGSPRDSSETTQSRDVNTAGKSVWHDENDPKETILKSFLPNVAVYASVDTEELIRLKGIYGGLCGLLRPFGESIAGNVIIRDSVGASKSWNNFGVRFTEFDREDEEFYASQRQEGRDGSIYNASFSTDSSQYLPRNGSILAASFAPAIDAVVNRYLASQDPPGFLSDKDRGENAHTIITGCNTPDYYSLYLRKLLSQRLRVPYETFSHPVACVIAISSQCAHPIETLRDLYADTRQGAKKVPVWVDNEFLRYYVLVHDEDHDDIAKSMTLFDQMKRHFGLSCHLLRLRSVECTKHDEDATQLPESQWLSAEVDLQNAQQGMYIAYPCISQLTSGPKDIGLEDFKQYLFDTDAAVIKTFVREMVTQSILPFMEGRVTTWNDQVASRRRGISGRFMSLSKRWTGFGSGRAAKASPTNTPGSSNSNYNPVHGYYNPESPEATMLRLADYAFILRDWKLAGSTYDLVRADFSDDKAWHYQAIASEMAAISLLLTTQTSNSKARTDAIDAVLDAASYAYTTRCSNPQGAARCLVLAVELYRSRGGSAVGHATRWGERLLEISILSPLVATLITERLAVCYSMQYGTGKKGWGSRNRKTAYYNFLAADVWTLLDKSKNAEIRLRDAAEYYGISDKSEELPHFESMQNSWVALQSRITKKISSESALEPGRSKEDNDIIDDNESDDFDNLIQFAGSTKKRPESRFIEGVDLLQRLNDPLDQASDGFV